LRAVPQIISSVVNGFANYYSKLGEVGLNLVKGLWNGISDATGWILDKIRGFGSTILNGIKSIFGIHSPSTLFRDEVGKNLALGVGEGFADTMADVSADMQGAIPTEFDADINTNMKMATGNTQMSTYDMMVSAFKQALTEVKVEMNGREMGTFVENTMERVVYA
jgi:phage-related protein